MIPGHREDLLAPNALPKLDRSSRRTAAEIAKKVQDIAHLYAFVQAFQNCIVHFRDCLKRTVAVANDVLVAKVKIRGEPDVWHSATSNTAVQRAIASRGTSATEVLWQRFPWPRVPPSS